MTKQRSPWLLILILVASYAIGHLAGLILTAVIAFLAYLVSVRMNPRIACRKCDGKGRFNGWLFTWVWHFCHHCAGKGAGIRWGAARWGTEAARAEALRNQTTLKNATTRRR